MFSSRTVRSQQRTRTAYQLQWELFRRRHPEEERATFFAKTGFRAEDLRGRRVLDAGCGNGRYTWVAVEAGASVVGLDLSAGVAVAKEEVAGAEFVQGDMLRPPFGEGSFDCIFAIGTLEHTPDARRAFEELVSLLRPGGRIAVWLHPKWRPALEWIDAVQRGVSKRLPVGLLLWLCRMAAPLGAVKRGLMESRLWLVRRAGVLLNVVSLGVSMHPEREVRIRDTFNWYAPGYRSHHTTEEVGEWFRAAGLEEARDLSAAGPVYHAGQGRGVCFSARRRESIKPA